jgi:hypothetical protein
MLAADYPFLELLGTIIVVFAFAIWFWLLIAVFADVFRRRDMSGAAKVLWSIFVIALPFLGVFAYMLAYHDGMAERSAKEAQAQQAEVDEYVRSVAGANGAASEIEKAKALLDSGAITRTEYDAIKQKALAAG